MALYTGDSTTNGNNLTNFGNVASSSDTPFAASKVSASFDGTNYLKIDDANQTGYDFANTFTIEATIKPTSVSGWQEMVMKDQENNRQFMFFLIGSVFYVEFADSSGNETFWTHDLGDISNTWTHIACSVTASTKTAQMYVNGSPVSTSMVLGNATTINNGTAPVSVGIRLYAGTPEYSNAFRGLLDEVRVFNDIRSSTEIADAYNRKLTSAEIADANTVAYYSFDDPPPANSSKGNVLVLNQQANSAKGSVVVTNTFDNSSTSNILASINKDSSVKADILVVGSNVHYSKVNILDTYSQSNSSKGGIVVTNPIDNAAKANVMAVSSFDNSVKAYMFYLVSVDEYAKANILSFKYACDVKANISNSYSQSVSTKAYISINPEIYQDKTSPFLKRNLIYTDFL